MTPIDEHFKAASFLDTNSFKRAFLEWMYNSGSHIEIQSIEDYPEIHEKFKQNVWRLDLEQRQCFRNSCRIVELFDDFYYVEGWTTAQGIPLEHAWIVWDGPDGPVHFDPTFELVISSSEERFYFAVITLDEDEANRFIRETGSYGGWMKHHFRDSECSSW